jgi:hypothetical protein
MIPPSALLDGLLEVWPYLLGAAGFAVAVGMAVPVKKKDKDRDKDGDVVLLREEVRDNIRVVTKVKKRNVEVDYDVIMKILADWERAKQEAQKSVLTQLALLEAKKEQELRKEMRDKVEPEDVYRGLVKVKGDNGKRKRDGAEEEEEPELVEGP